MIQVSEWNGMDVDVGWRGLLEMMMSRDYQGRKWDRKLQETAQEQG